MCVLEGWEGTDLDGVEDSLLNTAEALEHHALLCSQIVNQPLKCLLCLHLIVV